MSEAWRNTYDSWKLQPPPWLEEDEDDEQERLDAEARAESRAEDEAMEAHFERKYGGS
jgi:hypothetical protein